MEGVHRYLVSLLAAAIICSLATKISIQFSTIKMLIRLISAVFLLLTAVTPLLKIDINGIVAIPNMPSDEASALINDVKSTVEEDTRKYIIERTQSYIRDRAAGYGATVSVVVELTDNGKKLPDKVTITGSISPYGKTALKRIIAAELGIPEDKQIWK